MAIKNKTNLSFFSFNKLTNVDESLALIKEVFWAFMTVGLLLIGVAIFLYFLGPDINLIFGFILDGFIYIILALIFYFKKSRIVAIILLIISFIGIITTTLSKFGIIKGGSNIILAVIVFIAGIHGVRATFAHNNLFKKKKRK